MVESNGENVGPEAIPIESNHNFTVIWIYFLRLDVRLGGVNTSLHYLGI